MPKKLTKEQFIQKSNEKHHHKYDYSKSEYINRDSLIEIVCPNHGSFFQKATVHYCDGCGCPKCDPTNILGNENFILKSIKKHGDLYDYSKVIYIKSSIKVEIVCRLHGSFFQQPNAHMRGQGCPECVNNKRYTTKQFIDKSNFVHNNFYDYDLVEYQTKSKKVIILCPKHGEFHQKPSVHLSGHGCPTCRCSKLEMYLRVKLENLKVRFEQNKRYDKCKNKLPLPFDFYLSDKNILIECDGIHHRKPIEHFGGLKRFEYQKKNDLIKNEFCRENKIPLIRVSSFSDIDNLLV